MKLLRLQVTGFGGLRDRTIELADGVTVLLGPNEAGKSTVLHCLSQVLMGKPTQRSLFPDMTPWDGGPFSAALETERDGERYRLTRRFDESGSRAVALHRLAADGTEKLVTQEVSEVRKWVAESLGTADDRIFYRTFCLTQADLGPLDGHAGLREQLERATAGAEVTVTAALQRVDDRLAALRRGVGQPALVQNWGPLKRAEDACRDWGARLHEAGRQQRRLAEVRLAAQTVRRQVSDGRARIAEIAGLLERERRRRELLNRLAELRAAWAGVEGERDRVERLQADRERLQGMIGGMAAEAYADPAALRARLAAVQQTGAVPVLGWAVLAAGVVLAAIGYAVFGSPWAMLPLLLAVAIGLPIIWRARKQARQAAALCVELGVSSFAEAVVRLEAAERYRRELDAITLALAAVTAADDLTERRRALARDIAACEETLAQFAGTPLSAEEAHRLEVEQQRLQQSLPTQEEQERALLREVAVLEEAERDLTDLEDGVAYWQQELARAREEEESLLLARELLTQAGQQAHGSLAGPLAMQISPLFAAMTGGRYPSVRVEGDARAFHVHPLDAQGTPVSPEQLSKGTADQFVLAVRLALGLVIAGPQGSPVFLLDDPLLHFDDDRRREALALLARLGAQAQIILATHDDSILGDLPGATVVHLGSGQGAVAR